MLEDIVHDLASGPWALPLVALVVLADAFLVVVPGETAVTAAGALAVAHGAPPLPAVIAVAAVAAFAGDACCYALGRRVGLGRWRWMRHPRVARAFTWAGDRLDARIATTVFVARFIPFARLAVNLTAGATRVPAPRFLMVAAGAGAAWASYQAVIGAVVAAVVPGGPAVAVVVSVTVALCLGIALDAAVAAVARRRQRNGLTRR
ncbi:VTT domain-containing protein [Microbacterium sp. EYE_5]|uniref:DedA family protein n=1 Tax=unclassified Microbacterium TaxID=2609290 RepID=UPI0020057A44|nr:MULTISPECIES: VTT domain-containing protein [unclassified Microbacterium]MCK6081833.1 VTT domain-containing protein [Microbacterium sp. EYE_382]MCK6087103.1 VTT domain-containing protein [Microbacterium sp. EYE_384]MCK6124919.1 VTT domain-containing protein [Microbacterium sp. EYE_80]MCK6127866.1 VTT domain-containing protein [Microbacterium sp. EYE_79]MCK6142787.1 VTT domain-containing protein [Microbacterium sp. EYE_39]